MYQKARLQHDKQLIMILGHYAREPYKYEAVTQCYASLFPQLHVVHDRAATKCNLELLKSGKNKILLFSVRFNYKRLEKML